MQENYLTFKFIGFQERNVILHNDKIGQILWPIKNFPDDLNPGHSITLGILHKSYDTKQKEIKEALKELL